MTNTPTFRIALAALAALLPACAAARQAAPPASMGTTACGAVAAAIDSLVVGRQSARVGLRDETQPRSDVEVASLRRELAEMPGIDSTTMRSFRENNALAIPACATLPLVGGVTHIARRELDALPRGDVEAYWRTLHARFPGITGVTSTSGVGIGKDGRQALLMLDHSCGGTCGAGHIVLLERDDDGKWRVTRARMTWIS